jgi:hypothetical protein
MPEFELDVKTHTLYSLIKFFICCLKKRDRNRYDLCGVKKKGLLCRNRLDPIQKKGNQKG